jgi:hypothetical protein
MEYGNEPDKADSRCAKMRHDPQLTIIFLVKMA